MNANKPLSLAIIGAGGRLGQALVRAASMAGRWRVQSVTRADMELTQQSSISAWFEKCGPMAVINASAISDVDAAQRDPDLAHQVNVDAPATLARWCQALGVPMIHVSTDYVFGAIPPAHVEGLYTEDDTPSPVNVYGHSKWQGEQAVLAAYPDALVARVSWLHGVGAPGFAKFCFDHAIQGRDVPVALKQTSVPTSLAWLAQTLVSLVAGDRAMAKSGVSGVRHVVPSGCASREDWAEAVIKALRDLGVPTTSKVVSEAVPPRLFAPRPAYTAMSCERLRRGSPTAWPTWQEGVYSTVAALLSQHQGGRACAS